MRSVRWVVLTALACGALSCGPPDDYNASVRENFMDACRKSSGGVPGIEEICTCTYEKVKSSIPFSEFVALDEAMRSGTASAEQQSVIVDLTLACVR